MPHRRSRTDADAWTVADDRFSRHLPQDLVNEQLGRLALFSLIGMVLWTVALVIDQLVIADHPAVFEIAGGKARVIEVVGVVVSGAMFVYVRYARHTPETKTNVSLVYLILNAAADRRVEHMGRAAAHAGAMSSACRGLRFCCSCIRWLPR